MTTQETLQKETQEAFQEGLDGFLDRLNNAIDVTTEKLLEVAPEAAELILTLVQLKGGFTLITSFLSIAIAVILCKKYTATLWNWGQEHGDNSEGFSLIPCVFLVIACLVAFIAGLCNLLYFYNWLSLILPEGAIALKALEAAGIDL